MTALELGNARLKKMYAEEWLKAEILRRQWQKNGETISVPRDDPMRRGKAKGIY